MSDERADLLRDFFDYTWPDIPGQVYLATLDKGGDFTQYMLEWPAIKHRLPQFVMQQIAEGKDVHHCPSLFVTRENTVEKNHRGGTAATRPNIQGSQFHWVDFDNGQGPENWKEFAEQHNIPEPSMVIQSSVKGNQHAYWRIDFTNSVETIESINRALAFRVGADRSGWDGNQLLRPPGTSNFGYKGDGSHKAWYRGNPVETHILGGLLEARYSGAQFEALASPERESLERLNLDGSYPGIEEVLALCKWPKELYEQFSMDKEQATESSPDKRSGAIMKLAYMSAEAGFTDEQIYSVLADADKRWEKYANRSPGVRHKLMLDVIARARAKVGYLSDEDLTFAGLLGDAKELSEAPKLIYSWDEFLAAEITLEWLIEGLLSTEGYGVITGQPGTGKTQLGLQIAIAMALGHHSVLGWNIVGGAHKGLMFSLEMSHAPLKEFGLHIQRAYPGQEREIGRNLSVVPIGMPIDILSQQGFSLMDNILAETRPEFVYIDSLKKIMTKSLNDDDAIRKMNDQLALLRKKHGTSFYIIHHDRKKQNGTKLSDGGELSDMYGSAYIPAEADFALSLRKTERQDWLVLDTWKARLSREPKPKILHRENLQYTLEEEEDFERLAEHINIIGGGGSVGSDSHEGGAPFGFEGGVG